MSLSDCRGAQPASSSPRGCRRNRDSAGRWKKF